MNNILLKIKKICIRGMLFPLLFIILLIILFCNIPFHDIFSPPIINSTDKVENLYGQKTRYVEYNFESLYYSNYNYVINDTITGYYYYTIINNKCTFILISADNLNSPVNILTDYSGIAKLADFNTIDNQMLSLLAKDLNWTTQGITDSSSSIIINELEYHHFAYFLIFIATIMLMVVSIYLLTINIFFYIKPELHPSCLRLKKYGDKFEILNEADKELQNNINLISDKTFLTDNYFIELSYFSLTIIPINHIIWAYSHTKWSRILWFKQNLSYTLNIVTTNKIKVSSHRNNEDNIQTMISLIKQKQPDILFGFSKENKTKARGCYK